MIGVMMMKSNIKDIYSLTPSQEGLYAQYFQSTETKTYQLQSLTRINKETNLELISKSVELLSLRHEVLKSAFTVLKSTGAIKQVILDNRKPEFSIITKDESYNQETLDKLVTEDAEKALDLQKDSLFRVIVIDFADERYMLFHSHHIILDGWCLPVIISDLQKYYGKLAEGVSVEEITEEIKKEVTETTSYAEYANWIKKQDTNAVTEYWQNLLSDSETSHIYGKEKKDNTKNEEIITFRTPLTKALSEKVEQFAKESRVTSNTVFECAFGIALQKYSGSEDVIYDKVISGRSIPLKNIEKTVGLFVNTVPVRIKAETNSTVDDLLKETQKQTIEANTNGILPLAQIYKASEIEAKAIDSLFVFENYYTGDGSEIENGPLAPETVSFEEQTEFNLTVTIMKDKEGYTIRTSYAEEMYTEDEITRFVNGYISVLESSLNATTHIKDITVLSTEEREKILRNFNDTAVEYPRDKCIHELFEEQVERTPDKIALVASDKKVTYRELNEEANRIANNLIEKGIGKGDIVGLMLPRKSYLLSALFGILKTGAAYLPIDSELPKERIEYMCKDTNARLVVSMDNIDSLLESENICNPKVDMTNESLCYCIYTSGSTGQPKGVMARHRNVVNYISKNEHNIFGKIIKEDFEAIVSISTCSFDIFVTETIATLVNGLRVVLADEQECRNQYALNRLLTREKGQFLQTTPTKLKALTREPSQREFLRNIKAILLGGEAMEVSYLKELRELTNAKIYNIYGVTEVPIWSAFADTDTFKDVVTVGKPIANTQMYIVDKHMNPTPIGVMGELCIAGESVSRGYLNRAELTEEKFIDNPFGQGKLYKTGDHAYWTEDGNVVFIGRKDFQVKIRGLRIELGEIESVIQAVDGVERAVVVVRKDKEDRQLICAFYTGKETEAKELRTELSTKLPKYMVPHIFTHLEKMPMTASGKANRNALPEIDLESISTETEYIAPETKEEKVLTEAIERVLGAEKVSVVDNFFDLGGDSLKSIELVSELEEKGYTVVVKSIFESKDIQSLAKEITVKTEKEEKVHYDSVIPATAAQMRIYTSQIMSPESVHYNIVAAFKAEELDVERLQNAVNGLIARHEGLRTSFENRDGQVVQVINDEATIEIQKLESDDISLFNTAFDLNIAPLFKVGYSDNTVMVVAHHIIVDGESMTVLCKELNELYMGRELKETIQYGEFAVTDTYTEENEKYWLNIFSNETAELELPTDYQRQEKQTFAGTQISENIDIKTHKEIVEKCKKLNITPYVFYMACYNILLSKFSGNEDICVGMPISGRTSKFLNTIGMFVNTVVLRTNTDGNKTINELMQEIRESSITAMENQNYPYNELVKRLNKQITNRNPLFDVMFAYQNEAIPVIIFGDKEVKSVPVKLGGAKCDLNFNIVPTRDTVEIAVEYSTDLYKEETIKKFIEAYTSILAQCLNEETHIKDITVLSTEEREKILRNFNETEYTYDIPENTTLYSLFEKKSEENKDKVCIIANEEEITYKEFKAYAERIDNQIRNITKEDKSVIAVICERSFEMYGAVYGIIRGGNAYLPIDPNYPQERIDYILENSKAKAVVAQDKFCHLAGNTVCINATEVLKSNEQPALTPCKADENDTAYVIYTSGSTGNPKGAKISHKSAINRILWMHDFYPLEENDVILQKTPYTFDVSVWELFWWGITGRTLCASKPDEHFLPAKILYETEKNKVTHLHFVPSVFDLFLTYLENNPEEQDKFNSVKYVFLSGEALTANSINRFYNIYDYNKVSLHNLYGPTECAVDVSYYPCVPEDIDPVPIGKPIYNTQLYIVDKYLNPTPIGVTGELCIAGVNVGQRYLNNEALTNEKFIPNPFGSGKLYKTGDLAYWREDGQICYVGRMDGQIKLNGQRIELGEIEKVIGEIASVESVAVIIKQNNGQDVLVAFFCGDENATDEIVKHCEKKLPQYMMPSKLVLLEKMPLNQSGKLDRKALKNIEVVFDSVATKEEPVTETEKMVCELFKETLNIDSVGRNENFFNLGGTSLDMISLLSEKELTDISAADFIANPTPEKLARIIEDGLVVECDGFHTLSNAVGAEKALILVPFAGGDASAFAALTKDLLVISPDLSLFYVDYLHSLDECKDVAGAISKIAKTKEIYFYSHCAGTAVALQLINILEEKGVNVSGYITGGFIPPEKPSENNGWNEIPKWSIQRKLIKAGAPIGKLSNERKYEIVEKFRKDTDFMTEYFYKYAMPISAKTSVIISKTDIFTKNYADAERLWGRLANNFDKLHYIDTDSHYFQTEKSVEVAKVIVEFVKQ